MALKNTWVDKVNSTDGSDGDYIMAEDINEIAHAVIEQEEKTVQIETELQDRYTNEEIDAFLDTKANASDVYTKDIIAEGYTEQVERVSLVGITDITHETSESHPEIADNYVAAKGSEKATFSINFKGNAMISIISTYLMDEEDFAYGVVKVDDVELKGVPKEPIGEPYYTEYTYNGDIKKSIEIQAAGYTKWQFTTFNGSRVIYSDGYMSGEQAEKLDNLDSKIGSIDTALDELHAYAQALIGGES